MRAGSLALLLVGCGHRGDWDQVPIGEARLEDFDLSSVAVIAGAVEGDALLEFSGPDGPGELPVHLGGPTLGVALDLTADPEGHDGAVEIDLSDVDAPTVADALGTYFGTTASGAVLVGGSRRRMRNGRGASFDEGHFALGLGLMVGLQWVTVAPGGDDGGTTVGRSDTADTGHSAERPHTGRPTTTTFPTTPTTPGTGSTTVGTSTGTSSSGGSGCDCDGGDASGCDCQADSGCGCSHVGLAPGFAWVGVLLRRRRPVRDAARPSGPSRSDPSPRRARAATPRPPPA